MEIFDFFCKISFFEYNRSKTVSNVCHDLKNVKIAKKKKVLKLLANFCHIYE
jgi:hypothetical protein